MLSDLGLLRFLMLMLIQLMMKEERPRIRLHCVVALYLGMVGNTLVSGSTNNLSRNRCFLF